MINYVGLAYFGLYMYIILINIRVYRGNEHYIDLFYCIALLSSLKSG